MSRTLNSARKRTAARNFGLKLWLAVAACLLWSPVQATQPIISTIAGGGNPSQGNGDGGPATQARLEEPYAVAVDPQGNVFVAERYRFKVRRIGTNGIITTVAGNGQQIYDGDGKLATESAVDVRGIAVDAAGNLYISDAANGRIRKVAPNGIISTIVSSGLSIPTHLAVSPSGEIHIIDRTQVWKVTLFGQLKLVAGQGEYGTSGDGGTATAAQLANPSALAFDKIGRLYIVDNSDRIRRVELDGTISTVAGRGPFKVDPVAVNSRLYAATGVTVDSRGNMYVALRNNLVRVIGPNGIIEDAVVRGTDSIDLHEAPFGFSGDGGPALDAQLREPEAVAVDAQDNLYIADTRNNRIRKVTPIETPRTPAGVDAFSPQKIYSVGSYGWHVAIDDINSDGRQDALITTSSWGGDYVQQDKDFRVWLFTQQPDGSLGAPSGYAFPGDSTGGRTGSGLGTGDFNNDGFADVVVGTLSGITVFLGSSNGLQQGLSYSSQIDGARVVSGLVVIDMDRDGKLDVATLSAGNGDSSLNYKAGLLVYYGDGLGAFSRQAFRLRPTDESWGNLRATDINNDGMPDLTSSWRETIDGYYRGGFEVTLHDGISNFAGVRRWYPAEPLSWSPGYAMGDFDGDGRKDAIVSYSANTPRAKYAQFKQGVDGGFTETRSWLAFDLPDEMISADMNNDGRDDLLVLHGGWKSIGYMQQMPTGGLDTEVKYYVDDSSNHHMPSLAVGDLNGDGCRDVAMADRNYGLVVLEGRNCQIRINGSQPRIHGGRPQANGGLAIQAVSPQVDGRSALPGSPLVEPDRGQGLSVAVASESTPSYRWSQRRKLFAILALMSLITGLGGGWFLLTRRTT